MARAQGSGYVHGTIHRGEVATFDEDRGLGTVRSLDGEWPFHCTAIADGTRRIAVGAEVNFRVVAAQLGRWEATELT